MTDIQKRLFDLQDEKYRDFSMKLTPSADPDTFIGVRLPMLRALAKELKGTDEAEEFINTLPHEYFDEYHLHAFLLSYIKDFDEGVAQLERLLPYIDNWSTCDSIRVKAFEKEPERLLPYIKKWLSSGHTYTKRPLRPEISRYGRGSKKRGILCEDDGRVVLCDRAREAV